jgi:hypothetical protein
MQATCRQGRGEAGPGDQTPTTQQVRVRMAACGSVRKRINLKVSVMKSNAGGRPRSHQGNLKWRGSRLCAQVRSSAPILPAADSGARHGPCHPRPPGFRLHLPGLSGFASSLKHIRGAVGDIPPNPAGRLGSGSFPISSKAYAWPVGGCQGRFIFPVLPRPLSANSPANRQRLPNPRPARTFRPVTGHLVGLDRHAVDMLQATWSFLFRHGG